MLGRYESWDNLTMEATYTRLRKCSQEMVVTSMELANVIVSEDFWALSGRDQRLLLDRCGEAQGRVSDKQLEIIDGQRALRAYVTRRLIREINTARVSRFVAALQEHEEGSA